MSAIISQHSNIAVNIHHFSSKKWLEFNKVALLVR